MAFICSEFSLSHYLPKVRFSDTAAATITRQATLTLSGSHRQHQGGMGPRIPDLIPSPSAPPPPTRLSNTMVSEMSVAHSGFRPVTSKAPSHYDILTKSQSHTDQKVMMPNHILYWGQLLCLRPQTLGSHL